MLIMKKNIVLVILLIGILSMLAGCKAKEEEAQADLISFSNQPKIKTVEAYGIFKASVVKDIVIGFPAGIEQIDVKNGQRVAAGDTLMILNIDEYSAQLKQLEYDINLQKAQLDLTGVQGDLAKAQEALAKAQGDEAQGAQTKEPKDLTQAKENVTKEQENLTEAQDNLAKEQAEKLTEMEENLVLQQGKLDQANFRQDKVVSDISNGIVYNIGNLEGDMVYAGYRLLSIADLSSLIVEANIDQQFISNVAMGARVEIIPEYDKNTVINGTVSLISEKAFMVNGETVVPVEITLDSAVDGIVLDADVQVKIFPAEE